MCGDDDDDDRVVLAVVFITGPEQFVGATDNESVGLRCVPRVHGGDGFGSEAVGQTAASGASPLFTADESAHLVQPADGLGVQSG